VYTAGKRIRDTFWERRGQFRFEVPALPADKALLYAQTLKKPVFISDSGDNTTAGAEGKSTFFLSKILDSELSNVLIASLYVEGIVEQYKDMPVGTPVAFDIPAADEYSKVCKIEGTLQGSGIILGFCNEEAGLGIIVRMKNADIVISNVRTSFISEEHFSRMGITVGDYDYVVLKMGYLWPNVQSFAQSTIFALTPGTSTNDFQH
jgi:microcystin degradation protein MlrC